MTWMGVVFHVIAMFMFSIWSTIYVRPPSSISVLLFSDHTKRGVCKTPGAEAVDSLHCGYLGLIVWLYTQKNPSRREVLLIYNLYSSTCPMAFRTSALELVFQR